MALSILKAYTGSSLGCSVVLTHSQSFPKIAAACHIASSIIGGAGPWRREENLLS